MNRRRFVGALTAAGVAASPLVASRRARSQSSETEPPASYPSLHYLTEDVGHLDGRPTFSPDGSMVLFTRNVPQTAPLSSFFVVSIRGGAAVPLVPKNLPTGLSLTRPDWSWNRSSYAIIFNGFMPMTNQSLAQSSIYVFDHSTRNLERVLQGVVNQNQVYSYPSWYPDGVHASITNYYYGVAMDGFTTSPNPRMVLERLDVFGGGLTALTNPSNIWPGMSSVAPIPGLEDPPIAFAGMTPASARTRLTTAATTRTRIRSGSACPAANSTRYRICKAERRGGRRTVCYSPSSRTACRQATRSSSRIHPPQRRSNRSLHRDCMSSMRSGHPTVRRSSSPIPTAAAPGVSRTSTSTEPRQAVSTTTGNSNCNQRGFRNSGFSSP